MGNDLKDGFVVSDDKSMLMDIAPTILDSIGSKSAEPFEGAPLLGKKKESLVHRQRTFMIYDGERRVFYLEKEGAYFLEKVVRVNEKGLAE